MRLLKSLTLTRVGHVTAAWGVLFAVVHAYWAAGGAAGMNGEPADTLAVQSYIAFIAVLGLVGAAVAHGLVYGRAPGRAAGRSSCSRVPAESRLLRVWSSAPAAGC
jgi:hypothetical protein